MYILMGSLMNNPASPNASSACDGAGLVEGRFVPRQYLGSVIFAGMSGSAVADAGIIGTIKEIQGDAGRGYDTG